MKNNKYFLFGMLAFLAACAGPSANKDANPKDQDGPSLVERLPWVECANIYEVNVRQFSPEGTLSAFEEHLPRLRDMGVDILWFMPVQAIGVKNRKGGLGSYYTIQDYVSINPELGTIDDFKRVVNRAHEMGMYVLLDWVANHTAWDHTWMITHPDFYTLVDGEPVVPRDSDGTPTDWDDVADLNYENPALHQAMTEAMDFWVRECNIDGFRCDVAGFVPLDFWVGARQVLEQRKPLFMLAEWDDDAYFEAFDMNYGWDLHHRMNEVAQGKASVKTFDDYLRDRKRADRPDKLKMYFTTNHDENSWNGTVFERMGANHKAMFVFCTTFPYGMPLIYNGQEVGLNKALAFFEKDTIDWNTDPGLTSFYESMLRLKHTNRTLINGKNQGSFQSLATGSDQVYAYAREGNSHQLLVFLNFGTEPQTFVVDLEGFEGSYVLWGSEDTMDVKTNQAIALAPNQYLVLSKHEAGS